jgi:hypothetical protein
VGLHGNRVGGGLDVCQKRPSKCQKRPSRCQKRLSTSTETGAEEALMSGEAQVVLRSDPYACISI